jgi:hypothetical protein
MSTNAAADDDEERLVREVIAESPVEGVGIRDEWAQKVGWHRKEDVAAGLRGAEKVRIHQQEGKLVHESDGPGASHDNGAARVTSMTGDGTTATLRLEASSSTTTTTIPMSAMLAVIFIAVIALARGLGMGKKQKHRST